MNKYYNDFFDLLNKIRERPGVYILEPSLTRLRYLIDGYMICSFKYHNEVNFLGNFQEFVEKRYFNDISVYCNHWSDIILFCTATERDAFYTFFELLDEYKASIKK